MLGHICMYVFQLQPKHALLARSIKNYIKRLTSFFPLLLGKISFEPLPGPGLYKPSIKILRAIEVLYGEEYGWLVVFINRQFRFCR